MIIVRVRAPTRVVLLCPSCRGLFPEDNFSHTCDCGPWYSAARCLDCDRIVDGNQPHFCVNHVFGKPSKGYT